MRQPSKRLLGRRVLGDGLGALRHGVLGQFTREEKTDSRLDLPRGDGGALVVVSQTRGFRGNALEDVVHEAVHDRHGLAGDPGVGVNLLEHLVDVDSVGLLPPLLLLLVTLGDVLLGLAGLLRSLASCLGSHGETMQNDARVVVTNDYIPAYSFFTRPAGLFVSSVFVAGGIGEIYPWSRVQRASFAVVSPFAYTSFSEYLNQYVWSWQGRQGQGEGEEPLQPCWTSIPRRAYPPSPSQGELR